MIGVVILNYWNTLHLSLTLTPADVVTLLAAAATDVSDSEKLSTRSVLGGEGESFALIVEATAWDQLVMKRTINVTKQYMKNTSCIRFMPDGPKF